MPQDQDDPCVKVAQALIPVEPPPLAIVNKISPLLAGLVKAAACQEERKGGGERNPRLSPQPQCSRVKLSTQSGLLRLSLHYCSQ
jgi:hypothetical protein